MLFGSAQPRGFMRSADAVHSFSIGAGHARLMRRELGELAAEAVRAKPCALQDAAGRVEACPEEGCPFWEEGGAVLESGCAIERLSLDLARRPELAQHLLEIRLELDRARHGGDARSLFYRLGR
jgi:hypothetical protein